MLRLEQELSQAWERLANVYIECRPWLQVVQQYDRPHTLIYCDPPYGQVEGYDVDFGYAEYTNMAAFAQSAQGTVLISIDDHPDIRAA